MKIRIKTILLLLLCSMVPFVIIAVLADHSAEIALEKRIGLELQSGSQQAMDRLENSLENIRINFQAWSTSLIMQDVLTDDIDEDITKMLVKLNLQYTQIAGLLVVNDQGIVVAASDKKNLEKSLLADIAVKTALKGKSFQGRVGRSDLVSVETLTFSAPIRADYNSETVIGALIGFIDWPSVQTMLLSTDVSGAKQSRSNFMVLQSATGKSTFFITPEATENLDQLPNIAGVQMLSLTDQKVLVGSAISKGQGLFNNPGWIIHEIVTIEKAYASIFELRKRLLIIALIMVIVIVGVGYWIAGFLTNPIVSLTRTMTMLATGEIDDKVKISGKFRKDELGDMATAMGTWRENVIERKHLISRHRDQLQTRVDEAIEELKQKAIELEEALGKELELNRLQREFISMASHEFRTPLAIIDMSAQHLLKRCKRDILTTEDTRKRVRKIRIAVQRMTQLMESTLSAASLDEGAIKVVIGACEIEKLLTRVCSEHQSLHQSHKILFNPLDLPKTIQADKNSVEQILTNLLSNAVKYSPEATTIEVIACVQGNDVVISVHDHGIGIDEDEMGRIGERFFRARASTGIAGTGIGLNLANTLAERHGGLISVESRRNQGSTFTTYLPITGPDLSKQADSKAA